MGTFSFYRYSLLKALTGIFFLLTLFQAKGQTCNIVSSDIVCIEELMSFDVTASAGISSVSWDMGDATTSTQKSFTHKYSNTGKYNVKVTLNLTGGATCVASKQITVYQLPKFNISLKADNSYCAYQNNICLIDSSTGGDSGVVIKKRIIIWDDGTQSIGNYPKMGDTACHHYSNTGTFKITIEIINDKDCKSQKQLTITILKDLVPQILIFSPINTWCDSARVEFWDVNNTDTSNMITRIYNWGDGSPKITTISKKLFHFYHKSGAYKVSLTYVQKNGCVTTKDTNIDVIVYEGNFNIIRNAYSQCLNSVWRFTQNDLYDGAYYKWYQNDTLLNILPPDQFERKTNDYSPDRLGIHKVTLNMDNHGCKRTYRDSFEVIGIKVDISLLNNDQCGNKDTIYFRAKNVQHYGTGPLFYFWDLDDAKAPQCTTSRAKGTNVNSNCNFSTDSLGKHFYINDSCIAATLYVSDKLSGCSPEIRSKALNLSKPDSVKYEFYADRFCIGDKTEYTIGFTKNFCDNIKVETNLDSACGDFWSSNFIFRYPYKKTCNKDGWVTMGFRTVFGSPYVYTGFDEKKDFYKDESRVCADTVWKHNWFRLGSDPVAKFKPELTCLDDVMKPLIFDSIQKKISFAAWDWGDSTDNDTFFVKKGDTIIPQPGHIYRNRGTYYINYYLENEFRCFSESKQKLNVGFEMRLGFDPVICPGSSVQLMDFMCYMDYSLKNPESKNYWHIPARKQQGKEEFKWDFDDGRGFVTDTAYPVVSFPKIGFYKIKLAAKDSINCWDTLTSVVNVGAVHAGIKKIGKILCDGIVQLYDSSYSDYKPPTDSIVKYYWEFGDGGNPSYVANPIHHYSNLGKYTVFQQVENSRGCKDTAHIQITVEGPEARFEIVSDTVGCAPFTAEFKNTSVMANDFIWFFGDSLKTKLSIIGKANVKFTYTKPGIYYIYLYGSDSVVNPQTGAVYFCNSFFPDTSLANYPVRKIIVLEVPKADFLVDPVQCRNQPIVLTEKSDSVFTIHKWVIPGVDSISTSNKTGSLYSKDTGSFTIKYTPYYPPQAPYNKSCSKTVTKTVRVTEIDADFDIFKDTSSCPVFTFTNTSKANKSANWNLGDSASGEKNTVSGKNEVTHIYGSKTGKFYPCLFTENYYGCKDTLCKEVDVDKVSHLIIPNVFTPGNNDKLNDVFEIVASGLDQYDLSIYNRWGQLIFHSTKDGNGNDGNNWTGRPNATSELYPDGTYFYIFHYKFSCDDKQEKTHGIITLIGQKE